MPPRSRIDRTKPHIAIIMHKSGKFLEKKPLMQKSMLLRIEESSERRDDSPPRNASIGWTITFVYIAANPGIEP